MPSQLTPSADLPTLVEGDDYQFSIAFSDRSGAAIDITDWTVSMTIVDHKIQGGTPIVEKDITSHDDATGGKTSWDLPGSETAGTTGTKRYDIQVVKSDGTTRTVALGTVGFLDGATDRAISGSGGSGVGASTGAAIDVTLDGDDSISLSVQGLTNYTDADVLDAINGASISPGEVLTNSISVGQNPPLITAQKVLDGPISLTRDSYGTIGGGTGMMPPLDEFSRGDMTPKIKLICQAKVANASTTAGIKLTSFIGDSEQRESISKRPVTSSTNFVTLETDWHNPKINDYSKPLRIQAVGRSSDSQYEATFKNATVLLGSQ